MSKDVLFTFLLNLEIWKFILHTYNIGHQVATVLKDRTQRGKFYSCAQLMALKGHRNLQCSAARSCQMWTSSICCYIPFQSVILLAAKFDGRWLLLCTTCGELEELYSNCKVLPVSPTTVLRWWQFFMPCPLRRISSEEH